MAEAVPLRPGGEDLAQLRREGIRARPSGRTRRRGTRRGRSGRSPARCRAARRRRTRRGCAISPSDSTPAADDDPGRAPPAARRSRARSGCGDHVLAEHQVGPRAVVLGRHAEHRRDPGAGWRGDLGRERALVADDGDELRHAGAQAAALVRLVDRRGTAASACSRSGRTEASGGSCATSVRTSSGCFATSASALTAPPLLAKRSTGPPPSASMIRCRSSAWSSGVDRAGGIGLHAALDCRAGRRSRPCGR